MKILCYTDNHFCEKSSIITKYGTKYSARLENQLQSINWIEQTACNLECDAIICLGDFFDHAHLTDQELTAMSDIVWSNIPHYFLVGNHESEENDLQFSSTMALISDTRQVINKAELLVVDDQVEFAFLPYVVESNRVPLSEVFPSPTDRVRILFSHNDILGLQLGPVVSKTGYSIDELESICDLCLNGHLHNGAALSSRVFNLGNLTGKDFGENAFKHQHGAFLIDTATLSGKFIENPYAFNFYKLDVESWPDLDILNSLKSNAVISVKCKDTLLAEVRSRIEQLSNIIESRVIVTKDLVAADSTVLDSASLMMDQRTKFAEYCRAKLDNTAVLEEELAEILK